MGVAFAAGGDALGAEPSMVASSSAQPAEGLGRVVDGVHKWSHPQCKTVDECAQRVGAGALEMQQAAAGGSRRQQELHAGGSRSCMQAAAGVAARDAWADARAARRGDVSK